MAGHSAENDTPSTIWGDVSMRISSTVFAAFCQWVEALALPGPGPRKVVGRESSVSGILTPHPHAMWRSWYMTGWKTYPLAVKTRSGRPRLGEKAEGRRSDPHPGPLPHLVMGAREREESTPSASQGSAPPPQARWRSQVRPNARPSHSLDLGASEREEEM